MCKNEKKNVMSTHTYTYTHTDTHTHTPKKHKNIHTHTDACINVFCCYFLFLSFCKLQNLLRIHTTVKFWKRQKRMSKLFNAQKQLTDHQSSLYFKYLQGKYSQKKMTMVRKSTNSWFFSSFFVSILHYNYTILSSCYIKKKVLWLSN